MLREMRQKDWRHLVARRGLYERHYGQDTQFWEAMALAGTQTGVEFESAAYAFEQLVERAPGSIKYWNWYFGYLYKLRRRDDAQQVYDRGRAFFGETNTSHLLASQVEVRLGNLDKAELHAKLYHENSGRDMQTALPLMTILARQKRNDEFEQLYSRFRNATASNKQQLYASMDRLRARVLADS